MTETARRYSGQSPDERDAERTRRLLAAGRELFGTIGYAATSVERLCSEAKVSTRHFYQLHTNKESAFLAVFEEILGQSFERALLSLDESAHRPLRERVPGALFAYLGPMVEDIRAARIVFVEIMGASPWIEERRLAFRESLIAVIEAEGGAAVARGETSPRDFRFAALAIFGAANAVVYDWVRREPQSDVRDLEQQLSELALILLVN